MILWLVLALMTLAALTAVIAPLFTTRAEAEAPRASLDVALFRDQLAELERERADGEIGEAEAAAARREIERRLLAAGRSLKDADAPKPAPTRHAARLRLAAVLAGVLVPGTLLLYLTIGTPQAPAFLATIAEMRAEDDARRAELAHLAGLVEERLAEDPKDGQGWALLASAKLRLGRMDDARTALANAQKFLPPKDAAEATARFAQTLAEVSEGQALSPIRQYASEAVDIDADNARGHMLLALVAMQTGDRDEARAQWNEIIARSPPDSPFVAQAKAMLAKVDATPQPQ
ncbi:MAG: c-type cytochrome biogenesis protein CcmI [Gemmatimonas sp.]